MGLNGVATHTRAESSDKLDFGANDRTRPDRGILGRIELALLRAMLSRLGSPPIRVELWNGEEIAPPSAAIGCLKIHDRATLWKLAWNQSLAFGDAYTSGRITIEGDLISLLTALFDSMRKSPRSGTAVDIGGHQHHRRPARNTADSRQSVHHHYDIGNEFYRLWLDDQLVYTCAYFAQPDFSLEQAQVAKLDHICRKLRLTPGQTVVEAGFGWGALALTWPRIMA